MNKVMMAVGVAACVTLVGCKHDEYGAHKVGNKVKPVETVEVAVEGNQAAAQSETASSAAVAAVPAKEESATPATMAVPAKEDDAATTTVTSVPAEPEKAAEAKDEPAKEVAAKDPAAKDAGADKPAVEPEFTPYVVRGGDTLGGICYRYKVKKADVLALNPGMDPNKIFVGRTIKLPGNIEAAKAAPAAKPEQAKAGDKAAPAAKRVYKPYTGETKEYVVKAGDTIGGIAYSNGLSIRQFKELNGLTSDLIRERQKVKIPVEPVKSEKPVAVATAKKADAAEKGPKVPDSKVEEIKPVAEAAKPAPAATEAAAAPAAAPAATEAEAPAVAVPEAAVPAAAPAGDYISYTVKPNDDLYAVAIKWGITASQLKEINNLLDDTLTPGQVIKVPANAAD